MDKDTADKFANITKKVYAEQSKFFLNAFWNKGMQEEKENVFSATQKMINLDEKLKAKGSEVDEFTAHRFLELFGETKTVIALREELKKIDIDNNKKMSMAEYLLFRYKLDVKTLVNAPQGNNQDEIARCQKKLEECQASLSKLQAELASQEEALTKQKEQEAAVKAAEAELKAAVADLERQEKEYKDKIEELTAKSTDESASAMKRSKAANELGQLKAQDPLPLQKAGAALRKVEKERKAAEIATAAVEQKKKTVEKALKDTEAKYDEAKAMLEDAKSNSGQCEGSIWWMEKELAEAQKFLPKRKQNN